MMVGFRNTKWSRMTPERINSKNKSSEGKDKTWLVVHWPNIVRLIASYVSEA